MRQKDQHSLYDVVGVGAGPFNLSLAAILQPDKQFPFAPAPIQFFSSTLAANPNLYHALR